MSTKWRHKLYSQALISRKQRKRIITKGRLMNIAIQVAAFGLIKRSLTFNNNGGVSKFTPSFKISQSPNFHKLGLCYSIIFLYLYGKKFLIWQRYNLFPI